MNALGGLARSVLPWCLLYREAQGTRGGPLANYLLLEETCEVTHDAGYSAPLLERSEVTHDADYSVFMSCPTGRRG